MIDSVRCELCVDMFQLCKHVKGDLAECGVAQGDTTFMLDPHVLTEGKLLYAFDTFSGLPFDDTFDFEEKCIKGEFNCGKEFFYNFLDRENTAVVPVKGLVEDTLENFSDRKFCFVWLDLDLYESTLYAYKFFESRVNPGGIIGFHDYGFIRCPGIEKVVENEVDLNKFDFVANEHTCYFIKKKEDC